MKEALEGLRVLDFSRFAAGPYISLLLADIGADVTRVEPPVGSPDRWWGLRAPDGQSLTVRAMNRNKRGITLNLRKDSPEVEELLSKLVERSDVVIHNFVTGSIEDEKLSYKRLKEINPRVITVTVSGFGNNGPYADWVAFAPVAEAMSGANWISGFPGNPPTRSTIPYADMGAATTAAFGIMAALWHRERTGEGQAVDTSLFDVSVSWIQCLGAFLLYRVYGKQRRQIGNSGFVSFCDSFEAKDGWVFVGAMGDAIWQRMVKVIGKIEWLDDPRFKNDDLRFENQDEIRPVVAEWIKTRTVDESVAELQKGGVVSAPVYDVPQVMDDPQVKAREMMVEIEDPALGKIPLPGVMPKFSKTPGAIKSNAPALGQHNESVYCGECGLTRERLSDLKEKGVI